MFMQDPFQTFQGAYAGAATPFGTLQNPFQNQGLNNPGIHTGMINPLAAILSMQQGGQQGYPGIQNYGGYGVYPQQQQQGLGLQNPLVAASLQNPLLAAVLQNQLQNQLQHQLQHQLQNQLIAAALQQQQNPFGNPFVGQQQQYGYPQTQQFGGQQAGMNPWGQFGQTTLAPQSWVGQGGQPGGGQGIGQLHPLAAQLAARSIYGPSAPWGTGGTY